MPVAVLCGCPVCCQPKREHYEEKVLDARHTARYAAIGQSGWNPGRARLTAAAGGAAAHTWRARSPLPRNFWISLAGLRAPGGLPRASTAPRSWSWFRRAAEEGRVLATLAADRPTIRHVCRGARAAAASVGSTSARFFNKSGSACFQPNSSINPDGGAFNRILQ